MKLVLAFLILTLLSVSSEAFLFSGRGGIAVSGPTPVMVQHRASSTNPVGNGLTGNAFVMPMPNPSQAGDVLVVGITYPHGTFSSLTDDHSQSWPAATCTADDGVGNFATAVFVLPNTAGGVVTITATFTGAIKPFNYRITEFNNIVTSSPVVGSKCSAGLTPNGSSLVDPGSFTPTAKAVIWNYTAMAAGSGSATQHPTSYSAASGFTQLDGDTGWGPSTNTSFFAGSEMEVQSTSGAVDASMTITPNTTDPFNSVSVALQIASSATGGTIPLTAYIRSLISHTDVVFTAQQAWKHQAQFTGNLRVMECSCILPNLGISSVTDSDGNTWTQNTANNMIWYFMGASPSSGNTIVTINFTDNSPPTITARFYDVMNVTAVDVSAGTTANNCDNMSSISNYPTITPTHAPGLVIAGGILDAGTPGLSVTSPSGALFDHTLYTGENNGDLMENADAGGHFYNSTTATENWDWTLVSAASNTCQLEAVAVH
jgi:hypothetical protein